MLYTCVPFSKWKAALPMLHWNITICGLVSSQVGGFLCFFNIFHLLFAIRVKIFTQEKKNKKKNLSYLCFLYSFVNKSTLNGCMLYTILFLFLFLYALWFHTIVIYHRFFIHPILYCKVKKKLLKCIIPFVKKKKKIIIIFNEIFIK